MSRQAITKTTLVFETAKITGGAPNHSGHHAENCFGDSELGAPLVLIGGGVIVSHSEGVIVECGNWCPEYNQFINDELVHKIKPDCISKNNGCGNCPKITYHQITNGLIDDDQAVLFASLAKLLELPIRFAIIDTKPNGH